MRHALKDACPRIAIETLESRRLLSASLSANFIHPPASVFPDRTAQAVIQIHNSDPATTRTRVNLFASPTPDLSSAILLAQSKPTAGAHANIHLRFSSANIPATGSFYMVAQLVPLAARANVATSLIELPTITFAPRPVQFVAPNVDLTAQLIGQPTNPVFVSDHASRCGVATVLVLNAGTNTAIGTLTAEIYASATGVFDDSATLIGSTALPHTNLPSGASRSLRVPITLPAGTPPGSYTLFALVNGNNAIPESNIDNNLTHSPSPMIVTDSPPFQHDHHHDHSSGAVVIIDDGSYYYDDYTDTSDQSSDDSTYIPPSDPGPQDNSTTQPTTQTTTEPTTQPADTPSDSTSSDESSDTSYDSSGGDWGW